MNPSKTRNPSLIAIFTTVCMDLVGFGMIIPLLAPYGKQFGASGWSLAILGASYSILQFFFSPFWGRLSDRIGRRPILLMSLTGSTLSYLGFALATLYQQYWLLLLTRALQGAFAANLSAAQAYIADITTRENRAKGMGMIGAAFGIGFVFGPVLGGLASFHFGLAVPGFLASGICGANLLLTYLRLPESLSEKIRRENQSKPARPYDPLNVAQLRKAATHPYLLLLLAMFFLQTFAFSNLEQTFSLLFMTRFNLETGLASARTGYVLAYVGILGALIQGGLIRKLAPRFGERRLLMTGLLLFAVTILFMPYTPTYGLFFVVMLPLAFGRGLIDPSISSLISKSADANDQGGTLGLSQGLASLARALGPLCGLLAFDVDYHLPYLIAGLIAFAVFGLSLRLWSRTRHLARL